LFATAITLILVPVNIMIGNDLRRYLRRRYVSLKGAVLEQGG